MQHSIAHIALVVREYEEAIAFCTQKLGFTLVEDTYQPEQDKRWVVVAPAAAPREATAAFAGAGEMAALGRALDSVAERALEAERARLEYVFRHSPYFLSVVRGPDHVMALQNDAYYAMVGHRDLTGKPLVEADGTRSGIVAHGADVTDHVRARREVERLLAESEAARAQAEQARAEAEEARSAAEAAARTLGAHLGAARVGYAVDQGDGVTAVVTHTYVQGVPRVEGVYPYAAFGGTLVDELRAGRSVARADVAHDPAFTDAEKAAHATHALAHRARDWARRFRPYSDSSVTAAPGGIDYKQFRSNAVLRWEYRPGSTIFLLPRLDARARSGWDGTGDTRTLGGAGFPQPVRPPSDQLGCDQGVVLAQPMMARVGAR